MTAPSPLPCVLIFLTSLLFSGACAAETSPCPVGTARRSDGACLRGCQPDEVNDLGGCNCPPPLVERREGGQLFCEFVGNEPLPDAGAMDASGDTGAPPDSGPTCVEGSSCDPEVECQRGRVVCDAEEARCVVDQAAPDGSDCAGCSTGTCTCQAGRCQATLLGESEFLKPPDISAFDSFGGLFFGRGLAMSADGSTIVAGALEEATSSGGVDPVVDDLLPGSGAAYVFRREGSQWTLSAFLKAPLPEPNARCGQDVAVSRRGDVVAFSCPVASDRNGALHVFRESGGRWEFDATLTPPRAGARVRFGTEIAMADEGRVLAVGSPGESTSTGGVDPEPDELAARSGAVYVFRRGGEGWALDATLKADEPAANSGLSEVAMSADGTTLVAAAASDGAAGVEQAGAAYVFSFSPLRAERWRFEERLASPAPELRGGFGTELSLSGNGDVLAVAAHRESSGRAGLGLGGADPVTYSGAVYVFRRDGARFAFEERFKLASISRDDFFGAGIALADGGNALFVGAPGESTLSEGGRTPAQNDDRPSAGMVAVFRRESGRWRPAALLQHPGAREGDALGASVAVSANGDTVVATASGDDARAEPGDGEATDSGALHLFR